MLTRTQQEFLTRFGIVPAPGGADPAPTADAGDDMARAEAVLGRVRALPPRGARLLAGLATPLARALAAAREAEPARAAQLMAREADTVRALDREIDAVRRYLVEEPRFQARLAEARAHRAGGGAIAIEDYLARIEEDEARRAKAEAQGEIDRALAACDAQEHRHAAMMAEAERGADYARLRAGLETGTAAIEAQAPGGGAARPVLADVRDMMGEAENFTKSANWVGAVLTLRKAATELKVRTKGLELVEELRPEERDDDFEANHARLRDMIAGLRKLPAAGRFRPELIECVDMLKRARGALPDQAAAMGLLSQARRVLTEMTDGMVEHGRFDSNLRQALAQRKELAALNAERCVQDELARVTDALREADDRARTREYQKALDALTLAETALRDGLAAGQLYAEQVAPARRAIALAAKDGDDTARARLTALDSAFRGRDLAQARALAEAALSARAG